ncbi:hypothetical protein A9267_00435 [Shewanella sp. UCD-FRSSP16_17]|uniref:hypothetical protein n=1 Tax=Shewanella sp. UCD-FRSSP16_17 TaxID=1853256 RepID=UPI0007EEA335|nr:hypothetical protein [Shewanella sp. UCD-FRSSP16_17]OBT11154.1 hypothetical protein A9267_00435 [Shewanella sp. UCD-FRSSP16_17]
MNLIENFELLLAQRQILMSSFQCAPKNVEDNTRSLLVTLNMIQQQAHEEHNSEAFLCANSVVEIVTAFENDVYFSTENQLVVLQLLLQIHLKQRTHDQAKVFELLLNNNQIDLNKYIPSLALVACQFGVEGLQFSMVGKTPEQINQYILFCIYRGKRLKSIAGIASLNLTPLNALYAEMLLEEISEPLALYSRFVENEYCHSPLFEIFVTSLDEQVLTQIFNLMSRDENLNDRVIQLMGFSGFGKFVPFLAKAMQHPAKTLIAFDALRTLLGPGLDSSIPYQRQFEENAQRRTEFLQFYSAKLLNRWQLYAPDTPGVRLLNGVEVSLETVDKILLKSSPVHQRVAKLHQLRLTGEVRTSSMTIKLAS